MKVHNILGELDERQHFFYLHTRSGFGTLKITRPIIQEEFERLSDADCEWIMASGDINDGWFVLDEWRLPKDAEELKKWLASC